MYISYIFSISLIVRHIYIYIYIYIYIAHGIISPNEEEYQRRSKAVAAVVVDNGAATTNDPNTMIVDECEILDWGVGGGNSGGAASIATGRQKRASNTAGATSTTTPTSSHMMVELAKDNKTPLRLRDGDFGTCLFVIIYEEIYLSLSLRTHKRAQTQSIHLYFSFFSPFLLFYVQSIY